jgi:hypothetical protein
MTALIVILKFTALVGIILLAVRGPKKKKGQVQKERNNAVAEDNAYVDLIRRKSSGYPVH